VAAPPFVAFYRGCYSIGLFLAASPSYAATFAGSPSADCSSFVRYLNRLLLLWPLLTEAPPPLAATYQRLLLLCPLLTEAAPPLAATYQRLLLLCPLLAEAAPPLAATYQRLLLLCPLLTEAPPPLAATYRGCSSFGSF